MGKKGFFIVHTQFQRPVRVLLLFNKLSIHKKIIYDAFAETLGNEAAIDFYIYNNDFNVFKRLIQEKIDHYAKCVIIPHFYENREMGYKLIDTIAKEKLILMDKLAEGLTGEFGAVYEDFEEDIFSALEQLTDRLSGYDTLKLIFPKNTYYSKKILLGFLHFCQKYNYKKNEILNGLHKHKIEPGAVYINLAEDDLVILIEKIIEDNLQIGKDIGVISYNETPIKNIIMDGITTISTDFKMMGEKAAELLLTNSVEHIKIPFKVTLRNSL
ncbi:substrate-binding domain-containing protein [Pedobacter sp. NJ-S-72]